ncbi:DNA-methyltransferase [Emydomyces testavorans]|uniref:DNA (cytosine-5-)-methyltransferase n=1 Tax=Emydomyces testavorans TaxID=2070801 RepID=A0AAF0IK55_9EURO|nr:DNA-methyltransferase [Emydomyces testavorans]
MPILKFTLSPDPFNEEQEESKLPSSDFIGVALPWQSVNASAYEGFDPPLPRSSERDAIDALKKVSRSNMYGNSEFTSFQLDDFTIYTDEVTNAKKYGMIALNDVASKQGSSVFFFDGVVKPEGSDSPAFYLQRVSFMLVSIGGYEDVGCHGVGDDIWIQSTHCRERGHIWYRLGKPAREYRRYHHLFLWLANLAKFFVDYLFENRDVTLSHFKRGFYDWLWQRHHLDSAFRSWLEELGKTDFRHAIVAHGFFLYGQALNLGSGYSSHPLWDEIGLSATPIVPEQPEKTQRTIVTPYIYQCFKEMLWSHHLKVIEQDPQMAVKHRRLVRRMGFVPTKKKVVSCSKGPIVAGDIIAIHRDNESLWKGHDDLWYALVQRVSGSNLDLIWLYKPTDTICANLTYPNSNELFLSDHCNCADSKIKVSEVVKKVSVTFFSSRAENTDFFIRQSYHSSDETFTTLQEGDFQCRCGKVKEVSYNPGDTVLVETSDILEPVEIIEFKGHEVEVRELLRRSRDFKQNCRPNELVYTNRFRTIHVEQIQRPCHIRFYPEEEREHIPPPYNRDGNGSAFYITCEETAQGLRPMSSPANFHHGFNPHEPKRKLRALNLFSGGGSFDRGLEEGTAIRNEWAVEWGINQMLTYRANHERPEDLKLFCGSVNDYLKLAIKGTESDLVAKPGEVEFISGGSPCQGYSLANYQKQSEGSLRNCSMIASVAAYVDFYRPKYAILENVPAMASKSHPRSPLSQLICTFVGMGYQLRLMHLDAWSFGAPQSRSRLFLLMAAPGLQLPEHPPLTHSHPSGTTLRSLGEAPNGLPFGERQWDMPIFKFISAREGTSDLPDIGRAKVMSIPWPDHRPSRNESCHTQTIVDYVPRYPRTMGLAQAFAMGYLGQDPYPDDIKRKSSGSRSWSRVDPNHLMPTITTSVMPQCKFTGRWLHWRESRLLTLMEVRRAQGYPDSEVLIGRAAQQWKIVGNSVARQVALALGLSIREACLRNPPPTPYENAENMVEPEEYSTTTNKKKSKRRVSEVIVETTIMTTTTRYRLEAGTTSTEFSTPSLGEQAGIGSHKNSGTLQVVIPPVSKRLDHTSKKVKMAETQWLSDDELIVID